MVAALGQRQPNSCILDLAALAAAGTNGGRAGQMEVWMFGLSTTNVGCRICGHAVFFDGEERSDADLGNGEKKVPSSASILVLVNSVRLPRHFANKRHFCGTALVEFSEEEDAKNIMENSLVFEGANLEIRPKKEFDAEYESKKEAYEKVHPRKDNQDEGYPKGLIVAFKLKKITIDSAVQQNNIDKANESDTKLEMSDSMERTSGQGPEERIPESSETKEEKCSAELTEEKEVNTNEATESGEKLTGETLVESEKRGDNESLSGNGKRISGNAKNPISREDLKEAFKKYGTVRYVDFSIGDDSGYLRFEDSKAAEKARVSAVLTDEGGLIIKDHIVTLEPVIGEAEKDYWNNIRGIQEKNKDNRSYKGRGGKNFRGGKQFNGKRGRHSDSEKNSNKAQKVEAAA